MFPILRRELLQRQAGAVSTAFVQKPSDKQQQLQKDIAEPIAQAALATTPPTLVGKFFDLYALKSKGHIFLIEEKWRGNVVELRCYPPLPAKGFDNKKLDKGDVADVYGVKFDDIPRIVLKGGGERFDVSMTGKAQPSLDRSDWARGLAESALSLVARANAAVAETSPSLPSAGREQSRLQRLTSAPPRPVLGPPLGDDLEGAGSWRGQPIAVTSDRDGKGPVHVLIERRLPDGSGVWWPLAVPEDARFPRRGCAVLLEGDTLQLIGGIDANGTSNARFSINLNEATRPAGFSAQPLRAHAWSEKPPLKDAVAWAAAAADANDAFVVGGVASFYLQRNSQGKDVKLPEILRTLQVGGSPQWRERSPAPLVPVGAHTLIDRGCVFVGPGTACDGNLGVYDSNQSAWFALPKLPVAVGLGQLHRNGSELLYSGGFGPDGQPHPHIYVLNLNDPFAGWTPKGSSEALAGKARVVERDGKLVSLLVGPKGSLMVHLEA